MSLLPSAPFAMPRWDDRRVTLINSHLIERDAVGRCLMAQARVCLARGDRVGIRIMVPPDHVPSDLAPLTRVWETAAGMEEFDAHAALSDLFVYHYAGHYPLVETIRTLDRGVAVFHYHTMAPPDSSASAHERALFERSLAAVRDLAAHADLVVTASPVTRDDLVTSHGVDPDRIRVLPLAVPADEFAPGPEDDTLRELGARGLEHAPDVSRLAFERGWSEILTEAARLRVQ